MALRQRSSVGGPHLAARIYDTADGKWTCEKPIFKEEEDDEEDEDEDDDGEQQAALDAGDAGPRQNEPVPDASEVSGKRARRAVTK